MGPIFSFDVDPHGKGFAGVRIFYQGLDIGFFSSRLALFNDFPRISG